MRRRILAAALAALAAAGTARGAELSYSPGQVLQIMLDTQDARSWTRAEVVQTQTQLKSRDAKPSVTKGRLVSAGPKARLEITDPAPGTVVADGKFLWVELPQTRQVYRYDQAQLAASGNFFLDLGDSIRHDARSSSKRRIPLGPGFNPDRVVALELLPLPGQTAGYDRLAVWIDTRSWVILRVQLDAGGTRNDIAFNHVRVAARRGHAPRGRDLPAGTFTYHPPKGWEVFTMDL